MKRHTLAITALAASLLALAACGGGGGSSTGTPATSVTPPPAADNGAPTVSGTVTGFGSVIIDGVRIDDRGVAAGREKADGTVVQVELKLGQHAEVSHDGNLVATAIRVVSELEGSVDKVDAAAGTLTVVGQAVTVNTDPKAGPVTVFEAPYASLADVKVGDSVEVHGIAKTDTAGKTTIQATRIEKKTADSVNVVTGTVADLSTTAKTFKLGTLLVDYSAAKIAPSGATLANGMEVRVVLPAGTVAAGTAVKAIVVKASDHSGDSHSKPSELGGAIAALDATAKTMTVRGVKVDFSAATFDQAGKSVADLKTGVYVVLKGVYDTAGVLKASTIVIRGIDAATGGEVELHGTILNFQSLADFTVRDVHVDASAAKIDAATCGGTTLANGMQVEVEGSLSTGGVVKAASVKCEVQKEGTTTVSAEGTASKVDATAKTFTLTGEHATVTVRWSASTVFVGVDAATLDGKRLEAEGTVTGGVLTATKIKLKSK